jgi:16S rRNA (cytosine1402-N4)-methyltransferase
MTEEIIHHTPVMLQEVLNSLPANPKIVVDGTLWHGWHTSNMLRLFPTIQKLYWFDLDPNIFQETKERLQPEFGDKIVFENKSYTEISKVLWTEKADFVLVDLWVNLEHFKDGNRWFSTNIDGKLDMRFDNTNWKSAYDIVNTYSISELANIFELYAEFTPKKSEEIAKKIVETRKNKKIETTFELKHLLNELWLGQKACTVIFQAFRIETNKEIDNVKMLLGGIPNVLSRWWRCGIITFHSLEDRLVKQWFKDLAETGKFALLYKKAVQPTYQEIQHNRPSRSAKYRVIERVI